MIRRQEQKKKSSRASSRVKSPRWWLFCFVVLDAPINPKAKMKTKAHQVTSEFQCFGNTWQDCLNK